MIFNVLTKDLKDEVRKEYKLRRFILYFFAFDISVIFLLILLVPSYFSMNLSMSQLEMDAEVIKNTKDFRDTDSTIQAFDTTNKYLNFLAEEKDYLYISSVIENFLSKKNTNISVSEILYSREGDSSFNISMRGVAKTRESLISFTKAISEDKTLKVDLPVSNFTKDKDIEFTFSVIKNNEEKK